MPTVVRVDGLAQLKRALGELGVDIGDLKGTFGRIASRGARLAAGYAPHRTGRLRSSTRPEVTQNRAAVLAGSSAVRWAGVQNYGWPRRHIPATSFLQKADRDLAPDTPRLIEDGITDAIRHRRLS